MENVLQGGPAELPSLGTLVQAEIQPTFIIQQANIYVTQVRLPKCKSMCG